MKFAISAVVMLALALGVQSSVLPWGAYWGAHAPVIAAHHIASPAAISLTHGPAWAPHAAVAIHADAHHSAWAVPHAAVAVHGAAINHDAWAVPHASVAVHGAAIHHDAWAAPHASVAVHGAAIHHDAWAAPHAAVAVHAAPIHHAHEGTYVAQNRGAIHTAPLAGHINSASSINVEPAPGTH